MALMSMIVITVVVAALSVATARLGLQAFLVLMNPATQPQVRNSIRP